MPLMTIPTKVICSVSTVWNLYTRKGKNRKKKNKTEKYDAGGIVTTTDSMEVMECAVMWQLSVTFEIFLLGRKMWQKQPFLTASSTYTSNGCQILKGNWENEVSSLTLSVILICLCLLVSQWFWIKCICLLEPCFSVVHVTKVKLTHHGC